MIPDFRDLAQIYQQRALESLSEEDFAHAKRYRIAADKIDTMKTYIDDVCTVLCGPYRWCDDTTVLRKIEQLLKDGNKLLGKN